MDYSRLNYYLPRENVQDVTIAVIGCGAIGRAVASMAARLGPKKVILVDDDTIDTHNIPAQNWRKSQVGMPKVEALAQEILDQTDDVEVVALKSRWTARPFITTKVDYIWATVDDIEIRKSIFDFHRDRVDGFFDIRIGPAVAQMFFVDTSAEDNGGWYEKTLFPASEAHRDGCVQPMSNFVAGIAAGHSVNTFVSRLAKKGWFTPSLTLYNAIDQSISVENPIEYFQSMS